MFRFVSNAAPVAMLSFGLMACGEDPPPDPPPQPLPVPVAPVPVAPVPVVPTVETGPCDANRTLALKAGIEGRQTAELKAGMKAEGVFRCEMVAEGGVLEVPLTIQPNRCYTVLAGSFPNVTELDARLLLNAAANLPPIFAAMKDQPLSQDQETGPTAALNRKGNCYKLPPLIPPVPMKVVVTATAGAGPIALQIYSKPGQ